MSRSPVRIRSVAPKRNPRKLACEADFRGVFVCAAGDGKVGACALITPVYLEIALLSGARSGAQATGQVISAIDIADISIRTLREEGDSARICCSRFRINFYPRPPRGGRQQKQRENTLLLSHYTPPCTNCKEVSVKQAVKLHRYLHSRPLFQCEASRKTMCTVCSHWPDICR